MGDCTSDSDDEDKFEWDSDNDCDIAVSLHVAGLSTDASRNVDALSPSTLDPNGMVGVSASLVEHFLGMGMGFTRDMILKAVKENGNGDEEALFDLLLTYEAIRNDPSADNCFASRRVPDAVDEDNDDILENWDDENIGGSRNRGPNSDDSDHEDSLQEISQKDEKVKSLVEMGFPEAIAKMAVIRCAMFLIEGMLHLCVFWLIGYMPQKLQEMVATAISLTMRIIHMEKERKQGSWNGTRKGEKRF